MAIGSTRDALLFSCIILQIVSTVDNYMNDFNSKKIFSRNWEIDYSKNYSSQLKGRVEESLKYVETFDFTITRGRENRRNYFSNYPGSRLDLCVKNKIYEKEAFYKLAYFFGLDSMNIQSNFEYKNNNSHPCFIFTSLTQFCILQKNFLIDYIPCDLTKFFGADLGLIFKINYLSLLVRYDTIRGSKLMFELNVISIDASFRNQSSLDNCGNSSKIASKYQSIVASSFEEISFKTNVEYLDFFTVSLKTIMNLTFVVYENIKIQFKLTLPKGAIFNFPLFKILINQRIHILPIKDFDSTNENQFLLFSLYLNTSSSIEIMYSMKKLWLSSSENNNNDGLHIEPLMATIYLNSSTEINLFSNWISVSKPQIDKTMYYNVFCMSMIIGVVIIMLHVQLLKPHSSVSTQKTEKQKLL